MYILGWHVDGFGIFRDFEVANLSPGVVVFEGPNEAGKSTMLAFLRSVLFGFRGGRSSNFEPLAGGNHGGRIFLATCQGLLTVERFYRKPARIQFEDGTLLSEPEFRQLLGGIDHQTFSSVFAFSLDELRDFASIGGEEISARIFAAGLSGAGPSVRDVIGRFEKQQEQLLRPRSREGEINRLTQEMVVTEKELREARRLVLEYPRLVEEHERLATELTALGSRQLEVAQALEEARLLCAVWEIQADLMRYRNELSELPPVDRFVFQAREKLAEVTARLHAARERHAEQVRLALEKDKDIRDLKLRLDDRVLASSLPIKQLVEELPLYNQENQEKAKLEISLRERRRSLERTLQQLGHAMDAERLGQIDTSLGAKEELRGFRDCFSEATTSLVERRARLEEAERRVHSLQEQIEAGKQGKECAPATCDGQVEEIAALLSRTVDLNQRLMRVQADLESLRNVREQRRRVVQEALRKRHRVLYVGAVVLALLVVTAALAYVAGGWNKGNYALGVALAAVVVAAVVVFLSPRSVLGQRDLDQVFGGPIVSEQERSLEDARTGIVSELIEISSRAGLDFQPLGDDWPGRLVMALQDKRLDLEREATRLEEQKKTLGQLQKELEEAVREEEAAREALGEAQNNLDELEKGFRTWLRHRCMPLTLSPDGALDFLALAERGQEALEECRRVEGEVRRVEEDLVSRQEGAKEVLSEAGLEVDLCGSGEGASGTRSSVSAERLVRAIMTAKVKLDQAEELRRKLENAEQTARDLKQAVAQTLETEARIEAELHELIAEGEATDEDEFLHRAEIFERRQKIKERIEELQGQLTKTLGLDKRADALKQELEKGSIKTWRQEVQRLEHELEELRAKRDELNVRSGQLEEQLRLLENSTNIPEFENKLSQLEASIAEAANRWYVAGFASALLRNTLARYTEERQPRVLAEASSLFSQVTGGRYTRVVALPDKNELSVLDSAGRHKSPAELSRGTAEQLYLCLRLGLAQEFSRHAEPIPIVMDDVLVNFDPRRRQAMAKLLLNFAGHHQVLLFTCHPEITEVLSGFEPSLHIERMEYGRASGGV